MGSVGFAWAVGTGNTNSTFFYLMLRVVSRKRVVFRAEITDRWALGGPGMTFGQGRMASRLLNVASSLSCDCAFTSTPRIYLVLLVILLKLWPQNAFDQILILCECFAMPNSLLLFG